MLMVKEPPVTLVIQDDDPLLRSVSNEVTEFNDDLQLLIDTMMRTLKHYNGLGLSAIQIGVAKRVILAKDNSNILMMVNPVVTRTLNRQAIAHEGCLSIDPKKWREVSRPAKCDITWQDAQGAVHSQSFGGLTARILQHEIDHTNGILITDK